MKLSRSIVLTVLLGAIAGPTPGHPEPGRPDLELCIQNLDAGTLDRLDLGNPLLYGLGSEDAPVVMLEFSDYRCAHCAIFHEIVLPKIKRDYIDTGRLYYVALHYPSRSYPIAALAAEAAYCAGLQGRFWEMRDRLFVESLYLDESTLTDLATQLRLDPDAFNGCLEEERFADLVSAEKRCGQNMGVKVTPSFVLAVRDGRYAIDGKVVKGLPKRSKLSQEIEEALALAGKAR